MPRKPQSLAEKYLAQVQRSPCKVAVFSQSPTSAGGTTSIPESGQIHARDRLPIIIMETSSSLFPGLLSLCACTWTFQILAATMQAEGFSEDIIDRFFRPFLGGIFFDRGLGTTSRLFEFVMRCLATGQNCLPAAGIGAVAEQLASSLPEGCIHTGMPAHLHIILVHLLLLGRRHDLCTGTPSCTSVEREIVEKGPVQAPCQLVPHQLSRSFSACALQQ